MVICIQEIIGECPQLWAPHIWKINQKIHVLNFPNSLCFSPHLLLLLLLSHSFMSRNSSRTLSKQWTILLLYDYNCTHFEEVFFSYPLQKDILPQPFSFQLWKSVVLMCPVFICIDEGINIAIELWVFKQTYLKNLQYSLAQMLFQCQLNPKTEDDSKHNPLISLLGLYSLASLRSFAENEIGCLSLVLENNL